MCSRLRLCFGVFALFSLPLAVQAADSPTRKPLTSDERSALMSLLKAVDLAQETDVVSDANLSWETHVLKAGNEVGYVPFRLTLSALADAVKCTFVSSRVTMVTDRPKRTRRFASGYSMAERCLRGRPRR